MIQQLNNCKTLSAAKILIKKSFELIFNTFIVTALVSFATVTILLAAVFALILSIISAPIDIIKTISEENKRIDKYKLSNNEKDRQIQVVKYVSARLTEVQANPVKEAANMLDDLLCQDSETFNHGFIMDPDDFDNSIISDLNIKSFTESKDFAESEDVKTIINKYKADQNKSIGKIKTALSHIYTKNPEKIIDGTPHIIEFIRNFAILSTLAIHPAITLVAFCVDKSIELGLKRKEADRVVKYFKAEKNKIENKLDRMSEGDKKDRLEEYSQSLDKAIEKLEDYRDNLYSEKELDRMRDLEEATSINYLNKIPMDDYYDNIHISVVCNNISKVVQLFKSEMIRRINYADVEEFEIEPGESISKAFSKSTKYEIIDYFMTPDGMINIPLFKLAYSSTEATSTTEIKPNNANVTTYRSLNTNDLYDVVTEICSFVNDYMSQDCIITNYLINDTIFVIFNYLRCITIENEEDLDHSATEEIKEEMATILTLSESVDELESLYPIDTMKDLLKNIDKIAGDDLELVSYMALNSKCIDMEQFKESLQDIQSDIHTNPITSTNIMVTLEYINNLNSNNLSLLESSLLQVESLKILKDIVQEAKSGTKNPVEKVKEKVKDLDIKKVSISTNVKLAAQGAKNKIQDMSTKEKEISDNIDVSLSGMKKNIEKALTTDRREAIIKGSIIPSFSKIIKAGLVAGAIYLINPVVAAIGAIGAMACSKALTNRERQLLLDEIDIELKAVEKEISMAENEGKMKQYRQLLTYQRKLQRERQRIKYKLKITGRDNVPDVSNKEDD
jgi:hypothetical protein